MRDTVADRNFALSSVELCQVGIEHKHKVLKKNSAMSSKRTRITEDYLKLFQVGIEQVQGVHRGQNCWMFCEKILS
jgi:hypothetical protein